MAYIIDNEPIYVLNRSIDLKQDQQFSKFAFVLNKAYSDLPTEQQEQLQKILKSVNQDINNTLIIDSAHSFSCKDLSLHGIQAMVIFSPTLPLVFQMLNTSKLKPFRIAAIDVIVLSELDAFQKSDTEKKLLWSFLKPRI